MIPKWIQELFNQRLTMLMMLMCIQCSPQSDPTDGFWVSKPAKDCLNELVLFKKNPLKTTGDIIFPACRTHKWQVHPSKPKESSPANPWTMPGTWSSSEVTDSHRGNPISASTVPVAAQTEPESSDTAAAVQGKPKPRKTFTELLPQGISRRTQRSRTYPSGYSKICEQEKNMENHHIHR